MAIDPNQVPGGTYDSTRRGYAANAGVGAGRDVMPPEGEYDYSNQFGAGASPNDEGLRELMVKLTAGGMSLAAATAVVQKVRNMRAEQKLSNDTKGYRGKNWQRASQELDDMLKSASASVKQTVSDAVSRAGSAAKDIFGNPMSNATDMFSDYDTTKPQNKPVTGKAYAEPSPEGAGRTSESSVVHGERMAAQEAEYKAQESRAKAQAGATTRSNQGSKGSKGRLSSAKRYATPRTAVGIAGAAGVAGLGGLYAKYGDDISPEALAAGAGIVGGAGVVAGRKKIASTAKDTGKWAKYKLGAIPSKAKQFAESVKTGDRMSDTDAAQVRRDAKPEGLFGEKVPEKAPLRKADFNTTNAADFDEAGTAKDRAGSPKDADGATYSKEQTAKMKVLRGKEATLLKNISALGGEGAKNFGTAAEKTTMTGLYDELKSIRTKLSAHTSKPAGNVDVKPKPTAGQRAKSFAEAPGSDKLKMAVDSIGEKLNNATEFAKQQTGAARTAANARVDELKTSFGEAKVKADNFASQTKAFMGDTVDAGKAQFDDVGKQAKTTFNAAQDTVEGTKEKVTKGARKVYDSAQKKAAKLKKKVGLSEADGGKPAKKKGKIRRAAGATARQTSRAAKGMGRMGMATGGLPMLWGAADIAKGTWDAYQDPNASAGEYLSDAGGGIVDQLKGFGQNISDIYQDPNGGFLPALGYGLDRMYAAPIEDTVKIGSNLGAMAGNAMFDDPDKFKVYDMQRRGMLKLNQGGDSRPDDYRDFDPGEYYRGINRSAQSAPNTEGGKPPPSGGTLAKAEAQMQPPPMDQYDENRYAPADQGTSRTMMGRTPVYKRDLTGPGNGPEREQFGSAMYGDTPASVNPDIMGVPGMLDSTNDFTNRQGQIAQNAQADYDAQLKMQADQAAVTAMASGKGMGTGEVPKGTPTPMDVSGATVQEQALANEQMMARTDMRAQGQQNMRNLIASDLIKNPGIMKEGLSDWWTNSAARPAAVRAGEGGVTEQGDQYQVNGADWDLEPYLQPGAAMLDRYR